MRRLLILPSLALIAFAPVQAQMSRDPDQVEVPMQVFENGLYPSAFALVKVVIGGRVANLLLDTGASIHVLSSELAAKLDMESRGTLKALGASASRKAKRWRLPTIYLGGVELHQQEAMLMNSVSIFDRIEQQHGIEISGLLGAPAFKFAPVTLDFETGNMIYYQPGGFEAPKQAFVLDLSTLHGIPVLEASLADADPARFIIDTGHSNPLLIHGPYARRHDLLRRKDELFRYGMQGVFGLTEAYMGLLPSVFLGAAEVTDLPATVVSEQSRKGLAHNDDSAGNIGLALLARFRVTFDFPANKLYLEPRNDEQAIPSDFGISLTIRRGRVVIEEIGRGSPAEDAGLRAQDRIVAIDGRPCPRNVTDTIRLLRVSKGLRMMVKRGRTSMTVELKKKAYLPYVLPAGG
ncbi:MAG: aspartyl protease family protein [Planctomycetota bacterium]